MTDKTISFFFKKYFMSRITHGNWGNIRRQRGPEASRARSMSVANDSDVRVATRSEVIHAHHERKKEKKSAGQAPPYFPPECELGGTEARRKLRRNFPVTKRHWIFRIQCPFSASPPLCHLIFYNAGLSYVSSFINSIVLEMRHLPDNDP